MTVMFISCLYILKYIACKTKNINLLLAVVEKSLGVIIWAT